MKTFLMLLIIFPVCLSAQKEAGTKFIYSGLNYSPGITKQIAPILGFYLVDKKKNINDFQLNRINFDKSAINTDFHISASYHKIIGLNKKSDSKFYLGIGLGVSLYCKYKANRPTLSSTFTSGSAAIGTVLSVKPVINYAFTKKLYLGISTDLGLVDQAIASSRYDNPILTAEQQRVTAFDTNILGLSNLNFDLTLGFKIN